MDEVYLPRGGPRDLPYRIHVLEEWADDGGHGEIPGNPVQEPQDSGHQTLAVGASQHHEHVSAPGMEPRAREGRGTHPGITMYRGPSRKRVSPVEER